MIRRLTCSGMSYAARSPERRCARVTVLSRRWKELGTMIMENERADFRAGLGPVGVWTFALQAKTAIAEIDAAAEIEALGYPAVWIPESVESKEIMSHVSLLLGGTRRLVVAAGIANIWARDPTAMANGQKTIADAYPGRFVLGLGVSD